MKLIYTGSHARVVGPFEGVAVREGDAIEVTDEKVAEGLIARGDFKKHTEARVAEVKVDKKDKPAF